MIFNVQFFDLGRAFAIAFSSSLYQLGTSWSYEYNSRVLYNI